MNIWSAIGKMRSLSKEGKEFSFTYMSCDLSRERSEGIVEVLHARCASRELKSVQNSDMIERYINLDTMETRRFYQPLLMTFNGENVTME